MSELKHYGILRKSGRYPWGSGEDPYSRSQAFSKYLKDLKDSGLKEAEIAKLITAGIAGDAEFSVADLRDAKTISKEIITAEQTATAVKLRAKQMSIEAIADRMGVSPSTVRLRLRDSENAKKETLVSTADVIRKNVDEHQIVDIGKGVGPRMNISNERLRASVSLLRAEGYETHNVRVRQPGTKHYTQTRVLTPKGTTWAEAQKMASKIHTMGEWTENDGKTFFGIHEPLSISSNRMDVVYRSPEDGVVYVRPGAENLSMGKNTYAQVRIAVDGTHYIKGMAVLKDDLPAGVDLQVHSSKGNTGNKLDALKPMADDPNNPFGSIIKRQLVDVDPKTGKERVVSAINLVNEEGDWETWSNSLPSQMLSKQPHALVKSQLDATRTKARERLAEINSITNPVVRKKALEDFSDQLDSDAVELRAASLSQRQKTQVIIPLPKMNKNEVYAPQFETGEQVVLIRYPHGGRFEIPEVVVNNNSRTAKKLLGNAKDAIGIHPSVAEKLSGADFDGDTVVVIPNPSGRIKGSRSLGAQAKIYEEGLADFNPRELYGGYKVIGKDKKGRDIGNFPLMKTTGLQMGMITNLITDMSVQGAKPEHVLRAVKHSMVVIDAEKHSLNYKQSEIDHGIAQLRALYQPKEDPTAKPGGATTLLSRATAKERVPELKARPARDGGPIDDKTGRKMFVPTGATNNKYDPKTKTYDPNVQVPKTEERRRLDLTDDAYTLVSKTRHPVEVLYADHVNEMKSLANRARLDSLKIQTPKINTKAREIYKDDLKVLTDQLKNIESKAPLERRARNYANVIIADRIREDPSLREDKDRKRKVERQAIAGARGRFGLERDVIEITDRQWDAIQAGGLSASKLRDLLRYADPKRVEELSLPKQNVVMTRAITARAKAMLAAGATTADVARALGISPSTLRAASKRGEL